MNDSNSCTNQALNTQPDSTCMSMHIDQRVLALQAYSCTDLVTTSAQTRSPQNDHTQLIPQSGFEIGCTWSDMHEMSNNFLMMKNPNSLDEIQHHGNTVYDNTCPSKTIVAIFKSPPPPSTIGPYKGPCQGVKSPDVKGFPLLPHLLGTSLKFQLP